VDKPRDLKLAEVAFNAFYDERPPVFFDDLNHNAMMKWVRIVRAVIGDFKKLPKVGREPMGSMEKREAYLERERTRKRRERDAAKAARANGHDDESVHGYAKKSRYNKPHPGPGAFKTREEKVRDWEKGDEEDRKLLTDKHYTKRSKEELAARGRMGYRNAQRRKLGLPTSEVSTENSG
jgi:hypothetical protein